MTQGSNTTKSRWLAMTIMTRHTDLWVDKTKIGLCDFVLGENKGLSFISEVRPSFCRFVQHWYFINAQTTICKYVQPAIYLSPFHHIHFHSPWPQNQSCDVFPDCPISGLFNVLTPNSCLCSFNNFSQPHSTIVYPCCHPFCSLVRCIGIISIFDWKCSFGGKSLHWPQCRFLQPHSFIPSHGHWL